MNYEAMKQALIEAANAAGLEEYEIYAVESTSEGIETYKHEISKFTSETGRGICFRCIRAGKMGYAATESYTEEEAKRLVSAAVEHAGLIESEDEVFLHPAGDRYETKTKEAGAFPATEEMIHLALDCHEAAYAANELVADGTQSEVKAVEQTVRICNSKGLDLENRLGYSVAYVSAIVKLDGEMYDGSEFEAAPLSEIDACALAKKAAEKAVSSIGAGTVKTGTYPVVIEPSQMSSLLSAYFPVFSAERTQKGLSLLKGKEGEAIASECLTITDHPFFPDSTMQAPFDDEGVATKEKKVVERGVLKTLLYNLKTAAKAGRESTGNASKAGYAGDVTIAPYSFYVEPGTESREELLKRAEGGILITAIKGLHAGANPVTGDFSLECRGFLIQGEKKLAPVNSFTIAGNFFELLRKITAVGSDLNFNLPRGTSCFGSPSVLVSDIKVAGE